MVRKQRFRLLVMMVVGVFTVLLVLIVKAESTPIAFGVIFVLIVMIVVFGVEDPKKLPQIFNSILNGIAKTMRALTSIAK